MNVTSAHGPPSADVPPSVSGALAKARLTALTPRQTGPHAFDCRCRSRARHSWSGARRSPQERKLVVVVGRKSPLSELSLRDLERLYLGQHLTDSSGQRIISFNQPPGVPSRIQFDERVLNMSPDEMSRFWIDQKIRGLPPAPRSVAPVELLIRVIVELPGALGYLFESEADARVKMLPIEGKSPQSPGYPLLCC